MKLTDQFNATDPDFMQDIQGNGDVLEAVRIIEERRVALAEKLAVHCKKHRAQWTARQAERLQAKQTPQMNYELPRPRMAMTHQILWNHHMLQARDMVDLRIEARMQNLNTASRRLQQSTVQYMSANQRHQDLARQRLDLEVKDIQQNIHRQRMDAYHDFENNKGHRVVEARKNMSQTPERDVFENYKQLDRDILMHKEHLLAKAYEKHGFNYEMEKHALTQKFSQKL